MLDHSSSPLRELVPCSCDYRWRVYARFGRIGAVAFAELQPLPSQLLPAVMQSLGIYSSWRPL
jgi:hypothetical protein